MTKFRVVLLSNALILMLLVSCNHQQADITKRIESVYSKEIIQTAWLFSGWDAPECILIRGEKVNSENQLFLYSQWNDDSLYFFFRVTDTDLRAYQTEQDHAKLYLDDMVEVLIDSKNNKDSCWASDDIVYHVNLLGVKKDDRGTPECLTNPIWNGNAGIKVKLFGTLNDTTDIDTGYLVTLSLPWKEIMQFPKCGLTMGINLANSDNDGKGRQLFDWVGAWPTRSPYAFGNLILKNNRTK